MYSGVYCLAMCDPREVTVLGVREGEVVEVVERVEGDQVGVGEDHCAIWADTQKVGERALAFSMAVLVVLVEVYRTFFSSSSPWGVEF